MASSWFLFIQLFPNLFLFPFRSFLPYLFFFLSLSYPFIPYYLFFIRCFLFCFLLLHSFFQFHLFYYQTVLFSLLIPPFFSYSYLFSFSPSFSIYSPISAFSLALIRRFALQSVPPVSIQVLLGQATSCHPLRLSSHDV